MKKLLLGLSLAIATQFSFAQVEISGVTPAKSIEVSGTKLMFNGAGLREKIFLDLYVGSLYVTESSKDGIKLANSDQSMAITLDIVSGLITSEKMISAVNDGFESSTNGNTAPLKTKIAEFKATFKEEIKTGDHFVIAYIKDSGVEISKNGKKIKTIEGLEFKKALFGIWLGENPADDDLKEGMLGLD